MSIEENPAYLILKMSEKTTSNQRVYAENIINWLPDVPIDMNAIRHILTKCVENGYLFDSRASPPYIQDELVRTAYAISVKGSDLVREIDRLVQEKDEKHKRVAQINSELRRLDRQLNFF